MNITETVRDNRDNTERVTDWGQHETDLDVMMSVAQIINHQRDRDAGKVHAFQGRLTTVAITITF